MGEDLKPIAPRTALGGERALGGGDALGGERALGGGDALGGEGALGGDDALGGERALGGGDALGGDALGADEEAAERARAAARAGEALRATAGWAVPLQWVAILGSGGIALGLALTHRWQVYDWLFVLLCGLYVANAVGFRRLSKRNLR